MNIICKSIDDFCTMITTCSLNGTNDIRLFISHNDSFASISFPNSSKDHKSFTYILFTPLYTAIYTGNVKRELYESIYQKLEQCQEQCNHSFRIQVFKKLAFDFNDGCLTLEDELEVL